MFLDMWRLENIIQILHILQMWHVTLTAPPYTATNLKLKYAT